MTHHPSSGRPSPQDPVVRVMGQFGYGASAIEAVEPIAQRLRNDNYRVRAGGRDWVVKRYRPEQVTRRLEVAHQLETKLVNSGFPAAEILRNERGRTLVKDAESHYSVHAWVDGVKVSVADRERVLIRKPSFLESMGTHLGALHNVSATVESEGEFDLAQNLEQPKKMLSRVRRPRVARPTKWQRLRWKRRKTAFERWMLEAMPEVARQADRLSLHRVTEVVRTSDLIIVHNDINWENLIFDEDFDLRALIDFDNAVLGLRAFEVGSAAVVLGGADPKRRDALVGSYVDATGMPVDVELVDLAMVLRCVRSLAWSINAYLSGAVKDIDLLATWCSHIYASLQRLTRE